MFGSRDPEDMPKAPSFPVSRLCFFLLSLIPSDSYPNSITSSCGHTSSWTKAGEMATRPVVPHRVPAPLHPHRGVLRSNSNKTPASKWQGMAWAVPIALNGHPGQGSGVFWSGSVTYFCQSQPPSIIWNNSKRGCRRKWGKETLEGQYDRCQWQKLIGTMPDIWQNSLIPLSPPGIMYNKFSSLDFTEANWE